MAAAARVLAAFAALTGSTTSLKVEVPPMPTVLRPQNASRMEWHWSEIRRSPPLPTDEACKLPQPAPGGKSEWQEEDPPIFPNAGIGARRRMAPIKGMDYQLYLPSGWTNESLSSLPVVIYLHGHAERKWSVMNSQSLPRLLARNQSTSFDKRSCWCLDPKLEKVTAFAEAPADDKAPFLIEYVDLKTPLASCGFADRFRGIVVMPQGWKAKEQEKHEWTPPTLEKVKAITKWVIARFNGDANRVFVTGQGEGGKGAFELVLSEPDLFSGLLVADSPGAVYTDGLDNKPVWIVGDAEDGTYGNDELVSALKRRSNGETRYTRYLEVPKPADPHLSDKYKHSSDLIYRDSRMWMWAFTQKVDNGRKAWDLPPLPEVKLH